MRLTIYLLILTYWVIEPAVATTRPVSGAISSRHHASVGDIYTNGSTTADCYGTLISRKVVLTTGACLYDRKLRNPRQKIQFSKNQQTLTSYKSVVFPEWKSTGSQESDLGLLILPSAMSIPIIPLTWSPYAIEDISVVMATPSSSRTCSSGNHNQVLLGRRDNQTIAVECSGMRQEKPGAALIHETGTRSEVFGVYMGQCSGGGNRQKACGVRLSGAIFRWICDAVGKFGERLPECADPVLTVFDVRRPAVISDQAAYQTLDRYPTNMTIVLHYCMDTTGCTMCSKKNADNFASLDRLKSFHRRVAVRVVALGRTLGIPEVTEVPMTLVRLPGETDDRVFTGYAKDLERTILSATNGAVRHRRSSDAMDENVIDKGNSDSKSWYYYDPPAWKHSSVHRMTRVTTRSGLETSHKRPYSNVTSSDEDMKSCRSQKAARTEANKWDHNCTQNDTTMFLTPSAKTRFLGQETHRQTTLLKASIRCNTMDVYKVMCQNGGGNHAEQNLLARLRSVVQDLRPLTQSGKCEMWVVINNAPCYDRCSGASGASGGRIGTIQEIIKTFDNSVKLRLAFANLHPKLTFDDSCTLQSGDRGDAISALMSVAGLPDTRVYQCTFSQNWWNIYATSATQKQRDLKLERDVQTHCERDILDNNFNNPTIGSKSNCVYPGGNDGVNADFIDPTW